MANPKDSGTFDYWITNRITFESIPPKSVNTGTFDSWITNRLYFEDYSESVSGETGLQIQTIPASGGDIKIVAG